MRPRWTRMKTGTRDSSLVSVVPAVAPDRATSSSTLSGWWPEAEVTRWAPRAAPTESRTTVRSTRPYPAQSPGSSSSLIEDSRISSRISYSVWRPRASASSTSRRDSSPPSSKNSLEDWDEEAQEGAPPALVPPHGGIIAEPPLPIGARVRRWQQNQSHGCCPLVPEILNSIPSSMAVELFASTQDTSPPNAFPTLKKRSTRFRSTSFTPLSSFLSFSSTFSLSAFFSPSSYLSSCTLLLFPSFSQLLD